MCIVYSLRPISDLAIDKMTGRGGELLERLIDDGLGWKRIFD